MSVSVGYLCRLNYTLFPLLAVSSSHVLHAVSITRAFSVPFLTFEFKFLIIMKFIEIAKSRGKLFVCENQLYIQHIIYENVNCDDN